MNVSELTYPDGLSEPPTRRVEVFRTWFWDNSEICNNCFSQVRSVGEEIAVEVSRYTTFYVNLHYERTENGSQEHHPFLLPSDRYGECFCNQCGGDTHADDDPVSLDRLREYAANIFQYTEFREHYNINESKFLRVLTALKRVPDNTYREAEILAVATSYALSST